MELAPVVMRRLCKELRDLTTEKSIDGIKVLVDEQNIMDIQAEIEGPTGTPFEGGSFRMRLCLSSEFPQVPPKGFFITKVFHPNVSPSGEICVNVLKKDWTPDTALRHVFLVIRCLMVDPNPDSALNEEAGRLLQDNYEEYATRARLYTSIHAMGGKRGGPLTSNGGNTAPSLPSTVSGSTAASAGGEQGQLQSKASTQGAAASSPAKKAKSGLPGVQSHAVKPAMSTAAAKVKKSLKRL